MATVKPLSPNAVGPLVVPICINDVQLAPLQRSTLYPVTPTLSVDAVQLSATVVLETPVTVSPLGALGAVVSAGAVSVTTAEPDLVGSASETAVTVTVAGFGAAVGAVYIPEAEIVPVAAEPPAVPFTCQVTAVFVA